MLLRKDDINLFKEKEEYFRRLNNVISHEFDFYDSFIEASIEYGAVHIFEYLLQNDYLPYAGDIGTPLFTAIRKNDYESLISVWEKVKELPRSRITGKVIINELSDDGWYNEWGYYVKMKQLTKE